jgi:hypothetical protein
MLFPFLFSGITPDIIAPEQEEERTGKREPGAEKRIKRKKR